MILSQVRLSQTLAFVRKPSDSQPDPMPNHKDSLICSCRKSQAFPALRSARRRDLNNNTMSSLTFMTMMFLHLAHSSSSSPLSHLQAKCPHTGQNMYFILFLKSIKPITHNPFLYNKLFYHTTGVRIYAS